MIVYWCMAADCIWSAGRSFGSDSFSFFSLHCRERKERALWYDTVVKVVPLPAKSEVPRRVFFRVGIPIPTLFQESLQKDTLTVEIALLRFESVALIRPD